MHENKFILVLQSKRVFGVPPDTYGGCIGRRWLPTLRRQNGEKKENEGEISI